MTRPTSAGELLSQRPHTALPADDDTGDDESAAVATTPEQQQDQEHESPLDKINEQLNELLEDAEEDELKLTDFQRYWRRLQSMVLHQANLDWRLHGPTSAAAARVGSAVRGGQQVGSHLTQLYATRHLGVKFTPFDPGPGIIERPGVNKLTLYSRPIRERSLAAQLRRIETLANTDLQLAKVRTLYSAFDEDQVVNRAPIRTYRRVTTSERPCGLCEIAADQVYFTTDLMAIHDNCMCDVEMGDESDLDEHKARYHHIGFVQTLLDIGDQKQDIEALADQDAPAEDYHNLVKIEQHGELGPVIRWSGQKFTGPKDLPTPMGIRPVPSISGPGAGHEARMSRNAARVAQYRAQHANVLRYSPGHGGITSYLPPTPKVTKPIPRPEPKAATVLPFKPRTKVIDFDHDSMASILDDLSHKHIKQVGAMSWYEPEWADKQYPEEGRRRVLEALDGLLDKYPDVKIDRVRIGNLEDGVIAETGARMNPADRRVLDPQGGTAEIVFSKSVMKMSPEEVKAMIKGGEDQRFFFPGSSDEPYRQFVTHEFGHVLDNRGGRRGRNPNKVMVDLFLKSGAAEPMPTSREIDPHAELKIQNRDMLRNIEEREAWMSRNEASFTKWLNEPGRLSGYSCSDQTLPGKPTWNEATGRYDGKPSRISLNEGEAMAQAFDDVERRGDAASDLSKALHQALTDAYRNPPTGDEPRLRAAIHRPQSAVDKLAELTEPKPDWTPTAMAKEDNHSKNAAGREILTDEHRALARQLATQIWTDGAKVEPAITAAARTSVESMGGFMSGLQNRQKTGPSLYRKIQAEAIALAHGEPVDEDDLRAAAKGIKDAVRYTGVMPEEDFWKNGNTLRKALESLGAKTIKDPTGIPLHGYRGRNMAFELNGFPFEMQVNTELGVAIKDEAHQIYNVARKLKSDLEGKGLVAEDDPMYAKMLSDMQAKWDTIPLAKGTPVVQTEKDAKSGDVNKVLYTTKRTAYVGPTVPGGEASLGSAEMAARARVPTNRYGMDWMPDSSEPKVVAPARAIPDNLWNTLPIESLPPDIPIRANEGTLKKQSIDKVVSGREPFREGYVIKLYQSEDGALHVVDGHTRIAMYHALNQDMPVRIMDDRMLQLFSAQSEDE